MLANEVNEFRGDIFITYDEIKELAKGEKAVVLTRESGCEFGKNVETIAHWRGSFKTIYLIQRDLNGKEVLEFTTTKCWEDIREFLKPAIPNATPCASFTKHMINWQQKYDTLQKAKANAEKVEDWSHVELLTCQLASLEQKEKAFHECSICTNKNCAAFPFGIIPTLNEASDEEIQSGKLVMIM